MLKYQHIKEEIEYTGVQLAPHWIYKNYDLAGDAMVSFIGPCDVKIDAMVDLADVKNEDMIYSPRMLHFIAEFFDESLEQAIMRQRFLMVIIKEELEDRAIAGRLIRKGDDLYHHGIAGVRRKLSVSIATRSTVSTLIHVGLNIHTQGTPVPTAGLHELAVDPKSLAAKVAERFERELEEIRFARCKVRTV